MNINNNTMQPNLIRFHITEIHKHATFIY